jgi:hypothetical protein
VNEGAAHAAAAPYLRADAGRYKLAKQNVNFSG